ncbi:sensor histidine kinase [Massilia glaciei]|uniref:sensor histidine kinase n=1 Tax=Massilia glaciei TaxID=1524097 RepID=UPI0015E8182B|nr:histidine kinase [Massilia glaciei]
MPAAAILSDSYLIITPMIEHPSQQVDNAAVPARARFYGLGWALAGTILLILQSSMMQLLFGGGYNPFAPVYQIFIFYSLSTALFVWACVRFLNPVLARSFPSKLTPRMVVGLLLILVGMVVLTFAIYGLLFPAVMGRSVKPLGLIEVSYRGGMVALIVYGWLLLRDFTSTQAQQAWRLQIETDALAADCDRSELAMLEAQIEPHFLFNTLAHVKRAYRVDPNAADASLATLIDYLERALPALKRMDWTVRDELELITLYLDILEQRFGGRLRYTIDAPPAAGAFQLPALSIATLVENAVRHGLAPKAGDGAVLVKVSAGDTRLLIEVSDDGVGLRQTSGSGLGLATVRARLRGKFGNAAQLIVEPGRVGVRAAIAIELEAAHAR